MLTTILLHVSRVIYGRIAGLLGLQLVVQPHIGLSTSRPRGMCIPLLFSSISDNEVPAQNVSITTFAYIKGSVPERGI